MHRHVQEASRLAAERAREQLELELAAMRARVRDGERECAEQARRARQLKEEVRVRARVGMRFGWGVGPRAEVNFTRWRLCTRLVCTR